MSTKQTPPIPAPVAPADTARRHRHPPKTPMLHVHLRTTPADAVAWIVRLLLPGGAAEQGSW